jgi:hypothetical protein
MSGLRSWVKDSRHARIGLFLAQNAVVTAGSVVRPWRRPIPEPTTPTYELAMMIRVKDEARFLPEWMAHHMNLGFQHIFVYDNNSTDRIEDVIAPFVDRGEATYVRWSPIPASPSCDYDFLDRFGASCRWVAFFDADEFLFETRPGELASVLDEYRDRPAVAVCWRYFGSSGHETIPPGLVTEHFDHADAVYNRHVKVIARPSQIVRHRNSHNFFFQRGRLAVTPDGHRVFGSFVTPPARTRLALHHYVYRSREDYTRKARRGYVDAHGARDQTRSLALSHEFARRNDVVVPADEGLLQATADRLRALGYPELLWSRRVDNPPTRSVVR